MLLAVSILTLHHAHAWKLHKLPPNGAPNGWRNFSLCRKSLWVEIRIRCVTAGELNPLDKRGWVSALSSSTHPNALCHVPLPICSSLPNNLFPLLSLYKSHNLFYTHTLPCYTAPPCCVYLRGMSRMQNIRLPCTFHAPTDSLLSNKLFLFSRTN